MNPPNSLTVPTAIIDGDLLVFRAVSVAARKLDLSPDVHGQRIDNRSFEEARRVESIDGDSAIDYFRSALRTSVRSDEKTLICLSSERNWRRLAYPEVYKVNRTAPKPVGLAVMRAWVQQEYRNTAMVDGLEADDLLGMIATGKGGEHAILCSDDKDLLTIPGKHRHLGDVFNTVTVQPWEAELNHLYQTLIGDTCDGYKGCPKCGPVSAEKILRPFRAAGNDYNRRMAWDTVVAAYVKAGLTEQDALDNARMAYILQSKDVCLDYADPVITQWVPKKDTEVGNEV